MLALVACWFVFPGRAGTRGLVVAEFPLEFQASEASDNIDLVMIEVQKHLGLRVNWKEAESTLPGFTEVDTQAHRAAGACRRPHSWLAAEASAGVFCSPRPDSVTTPTCLGSVLCPLAASTFYSLNPGPSPDSSSGMGTAHPRLPCQKRKAVFHQPRVLCLSPARHRERLEEASILQARR